MATLNFYPKSPDKQGMSVVLLTYQGDGKKFRFAAKAKISSKQWLEKRQRVKVKDKIDELVNNHLDTLASYISTAEKESLLMHERIDFEYVQERFFEKVRPKKKEVVRKVKVKTFHGYFEEFLEEIKITRKHWTRKQYQGAYNHLLKFEEEKGYQLKFESINHTFYSAYVNHLMEDCKLLNNSVGVLVKVLKAFMTWATDKEYNSNMNYKKFKVFKEDAETIYLTERELMTLYSFEDLTPAQKQARDLFCFACFTGLRYSDFSQFNADTVKGDYLEIKTEKTRQFLKIPLNKYAKEILGRYNGKLPKGITNQKTNECLKEIAFKCGFFQELRLTKYRGAEKVERLDSKYKFITTHTARRTFVTLCLEKGMRPETVMSITGHKDYHSFKKYIKLTDNVKLLEMNKIWNS